MTFSVYTELIADMTMNKTMPQPGSPSQSCKQQYKAETPTRGCASQSANCLRQSMQPVILPTVVLILLSIISCQIGYTNQQQQALCPKVCHCDEQALEITCRGSVLATGLPLTLHPSTKRMTINHAQITIFSTLDYIKNLETLDLAYNRIGSIDFVHINSNANLISFNASHNKLSELKDTTVSTAISKLDPGSINTFTSSPNTEEAEKLRAALRKAKINVLELILSHNHLTILRNFTFLRWTKLQRLDLSFNSLVSLETESLFGLIKLKHLNVRGNQLIQVPGQALKGTARSLNFISSTSESALSQLRSLDLSENALVSLDSNSFLSLGQLQELHLDLCSLQSIDDGAFKDLTNLNLLSLNHNDLMEVPTDSFSYLNNLKQLLLDSNRIQQLRPHAFGSLFNLEELYINNGSLRELQMHALSGLISLKRFSLARNSNLTKVYANILDDVPQLVHLDFYMCSLSSLTAENSLDGRPLTILDLRGNPLRCDCQLKWLTKWFHSWNETVLMNLDHSKTPSQLNTLVYQNYVKNYLTDNTFAQELINITCAKPPALTGKLVIDLPDNKLECIRPTSSLNLRVGFASLFLMLLLLVSACMVNFCRNERHIIGIIKENLAQNRISMMLPYSQDTHKNLDNFEKETHMECAEYEPVDYSQTSGPIYTIPGDQQQTHQM